ncbi:hypothetical protein RUM43_007188 [Polyplax serrata]|uniref:Protein ARV n=1 Tax=Polyplax serrata TaxID=468196 RepID=A0AAN8PLX9_POLSC
MLKYSIPFLFQAHCGNVGDKYLEYDKVIVIIDLILFSKEAYRHVLFNLQYKGYMKLAFLQLLILSFDEWFNSKNTVRFQDSDFYELRFYTVCFATFIGKLLFLIVILVGVNTYTQSGLRHTLIQKNSLAIVKATICSSFGYFLLLTILIWDEQREIHLIFIHVYTILSQIQALTVTTPVPRFVLGVVCTVANATDQLFSACLRKSLYV